MAPIGCSGARGKLIHEKNLKLKISIQTPFNRNKIVTIESPNSKKLLTGLRIAESACASLMHFLRWKPPTTAVKREMNAKTG